MDLKLDQWPGIRERFETPRVLRTRSGSPFRVRASDDAVVVTPSSGVERVIPERELRLAWPFIRSGVRRSDWKPTSANPGYLESIFDDIVDWQGALQSAADPASDQADTDRVHEVEGLRAALVAQEADLVAARSLVTLANEELRHLTDQVRSMGSAEAEVVELRGRLERERENRGSLEAALAVERSNLDAVQVRLEERAKIIFDLRKRLAESASKPSPVATTPTSGRPVELTIPIGILPDLARGLEAARTRAFVDPDASVAECRRVLEASARAIWEKSNGLKLGVAKPFFDIMADLRNSPSVPVSDWHLAKTVYGRASNVIHEGGASIQESLWVWLGTVQVAELASNPVVRPPRGTRAPTPGHGPLKEAGPLPGGPQGYPSTSRLTDARWQVQGSPGTRKRQ